MIAMNVTLQNYMLFKLPLKIFRSTPLFGHAWRIRGF